MGLREQQLTTARRFSFSFLPFSGYHIWSFDNGLVIPERFRVFRLIYYTSMKRHSLIFTHTPLFLVVHAPILQSLPFVLVVALFLGQTDYFVLPLEVFMCLT